MSESLPYRYRKILRYALRQWPRLVLIAALTIGTSAVAVLQPWPMKLLVDHALGGSELPAIFADALVYLSVDSSAATLVVVAGLASLALFAVNSAIDSLLNWAWMAAGQRMVYDLAADLFHRLQRLSLLLHSRRSIGDSLNRLTGDTWCVFKVTEGLLISPAQRILTLIGVGAIALSINPALGFVALAAAPLMAGSSFYFGRRIKQSARLSREARSNLISFVQQTLSTIPAVQAFTSEDRNVTYFNDLSERVAEQAQRNTVARSGYEVFNGTISAAGVAAVVAMGSWQVVDGTLTVGSLLVFIAYVRTLDSCLQGLLGQYAELKSVEASVDRVIEILDHRESVEDPVEPIPLDAGSNGGRGHITVENVSFAYEPNRPVLVDISFEARHGEVVALVGPTGSGKSTITSLLMRFFDPDHGRILFDGVDLRKLNLAALRAQFSIVLQEPFLLPLTIAENIAYGRPSASPEGIIEAAKAANAHDFIQRLPDGYGTIIGERGATLSGGERQRLAIARALLMDTPVLILDEPTSSLDVATEQSVLQALDRLIQGRTTLIIAHRLTTVRNANRILVLDRGRLVECGTHEDLLKAEGAYYTLYHQRFAVAGEVSA